MFFRILLEVFVINLELIPYVIKPLLAAGITGLVVSAVLWQLQIREHKNTQKLLNTEELNLGEPLDLYAAVKFGLVFAGVLLLTKFMSLNYGNNGVYLTAIISGFVDTDAITVSLANMVKNNGLSPETASIAITFATLSNTFIKGVFVLFLGSRAVAIRTIISVLLIMAAGLASLFFL